jgi:hypothetical protein
MILKKKPGPPPIYSAVHYGKAISMLVGEILFAQVINTGRMHLLSETDCASVIGTDQSLVGTIRIWTWRLTIVLSLEYSTSGSRSSSGRRRCASYGCH